MTPDMGMAEVAKKILTSQNTLPDIGMAEVAKLS